MISIKKGSILDPTTNIRGHNESIIRVYFNDRV